MKKRGKEHIWPLWIHEFDDTTDSKLQIGRHVGLLSNFGLIDERTQSSNSFVFGHVCQDCNTGWMSRLEDDAAPMIKDVADNSSDAKQWSAEQAQTVATWTFKTALMINAGTNYKRIVPKVHYRNLYNRKKPPHGVKIEIALAKDMIIGREFQQSQNVSIVGPNKIVLEKQKHLRKAYVIGLALKHLMLRVSYWPDHTAEINPSSGMSLLYKGKAETIDFEKVSVLDTTTALGISLVVYS
jgi:hypothetical protein